MPEILNKSPFNFMAVVKRFAYIWNWTVVQEVFIMLISK